MDIVSQPSGDKGGFYWFLFTAARGCARISVVGNRALVRIDNVAF